MDIFLLVLATIFNGGYSVCSALYSRKTKEKGDAFLYTAFVSFAALIFFLCYSKFQLRFDSYTFLMSILFAMAYILVSITTIYAVKCGPVALTTIFIAFSLLIPTFFGVIYWKESVGVLFYIGVVLFCASIVFMNLPNKNIKSNTEEGEEKKKNKISVKWIVLVSLAFLGNGSCSVIQTFHQKSGGADFKSEFMLFAMVIVFIVNMVISLSINKGRIIYHFKDCTIGFAGGIMNAVVNLTVLVLSSSGVIGQSVFFPVISVGSMIVVYLSSLLIFKEKLKLNQNLGVVLGVIAIVLLQI